MPWTIVTLIGWKPSEQELQLQLQLLREIHALLFECSVNGLRERQRCLKEAGEEACPLRWFDRPPALFFLRKLFCGSPQRSNPVLHKPGDCYVGNRSFKKKKDQVHIERHLFFFLMDLCESKRDLLSWYSLQPAKMYRSCINHSEGNFPYICHRVSQYCEPLFASLQ